MTSTDTRPATEEAPGRIPTAHPTLWAMLRLHRSATWLWIAFVVAMTVVMLWLRYGPYGTGSVRLQESCGADDVRDCFTNPAKGEDLYSLLFGIDYVASTLRNIAPVVAGWAGGALIARELASGTAELAWTQAVTPTRWLTEKLAVPAAFLASGTAFLVLHFITLMYWADAHHLLIAGYTIQDYYFAFGPSAVAYVLLGLAVGVLAGFLSREMFPALAIGAAVTWTVSWLINPWRTQIWPTVTRTAKGEGPFGFAARPCQWEQSEHKYSVDACLGAQPASRYWPVQLVETGFVLALAVLAVGAAYWLLRRRTP